MLMQRVVACLQGTTITFEDRRKLIRTGTLIGLTPFHSELIIAIAQDQARRGIPPRSIAEQGTGQLECIPAPEPRPRSSPILRAMWWAGAIISAEIAILIWLL
ncbi:MAG: hypothetical protein JJU36_01475 [Phycisphaeraceae bacterium]|nr:hypothetical protein [Phycisphaeraceae bacterium]